ncbi:MAG: flagellar protein FlaG [Sulfuricurvum sp.]
MEIFQTTAKVQQSQTSPQSLNKSDLHKTQTVQEAEKSKINDNKMAESKNAENANKNKTENQVSKLVDELNRSLDPFNTSIRFGFDNTSDIFYVSVIETQSNRMIRRFPAEEAQALLPKIQEVNGLLFDERG